MTLAWMTDVDNREITPRHSPRPDRASELMTGWPVLDVSQIGELEKDLL